MAWPWLTTAVTAVACGKDSPAPTEPRETDPGGGFRVAVNVAADTVSPGDALPIRVEVNAPQTDSRVGVFGVRVSGALNGQVELGSNLTGSQTVNLLLDIPTGRIEGPLYVVAYVQTPLGEATGADTSSVWDRRNPKVLTPLSWPEAAEPGKSLAFSWTAIDNAAIVTTVVRTYGAVVTADSQAHDSRLGVEVTGSIPVPADARLGDLVHFQLIAVDYRGNADTLAPPAVPLADLTRPMVTASLGPHQSEPSLLEESPTYLTGDTLRLTVTGQDERALAWVGWRFLPRAGASWLADSVGVTGDSASWTSEIVAQAGWHSTALSGFARDSTGNETQVPVQVLVYDAIRRPYVSVADHYIGRVADFGYDGIRQRLYLAVPDSGWLAVLDIVTGTFLPAIPLPGSPLSLDRVPSGDSLIVVLDLASELAVVDLAGASATVSTLPLTSLDPSQNEPAHVRVANNGKVFVVSRYGGGAYQVDLTTGEQRPYPDLGWGPGIFASKSRNALVTYGSWAFVYRTATDSVDTYYSIDLSAPPDIDAAGTLMLSQDRIYDLGFTYLRSLTAPGEALGGAYALSWDGSAAYYSIEGLQGYRKVSASDGARLEHVAFLGAPDRLDEVGDGSYLLAWFGEGAPRYIVDLSDPPFGATRRARRQ